MLIYTSEEQILDLDQEGVNLEVGFGDQTFLLLAPKGYLQSRDDIITAEQAMALGSNLELTEKEEIANEILLDIKDVELEGVVRDVTHFPPAFHFFEAKPGIEDSEIFSIIRQLPKGASLHTHLGAATSLEYVVENLINRDNLYGCVVKRRLKLRFFQSNNITTDCKWRLIKDLRKIIPSFNTWIKSQFSVIDSSNNIHDVWENFVATFRTLSGMTNYRPVFQEYLYQALTELHADNVFYVEFRSGFRQLYELNGRTYSPPEFLEIFSATVQTFKRNHPRFVGAKIIYTTIRTLNTSQIDQALQNFHTLQMTYPTVLVGFDLVGFEDTGKLLLDYHPLLNAVQNKTRFFFHVGETNWNGYDVDYNLVDAVLLGTKRIGHGYALTKHPKIMEIVKERDIAIELSPISNQILRHVADLRNHPAAALIAQGFPVVVCNDDPGFWGVRGLSYDWYVTYMAMARKDAGLEFLKQLALNSLKYSAMEEKEKVLAIRDWKTVWDEFIDNLIQLQVPD